MANEKNEPEILSRESNATTQRTKVKLDQIKIDMERFCHRDPSALSKDSLKTLMESLIQEGLQVPIEVYRDDQDRIVLVKGHRRVTGCRHLAGENAVGFKADMEIEAIEVKAEPADLLLRSILDNEVRLNLDRTSRIRVSKKLYDAGVPVERAARAMGVSVKTFDRDLLIARYGWMFQHVIDGSIAPTHATVLLEEAEKAGRIAELKEDLDAWIAKKKQMIREKEKLRKARDGKELSPADKQVKKFLPNYLVTHWVQLLRDKKRFDDDASWNYSAGIETETEQLRISSVSLDLSKASLDQLAKVASKLSLVTKQMGPYLKKAHEKEAGEVTPDAAESPYDFDYLRELGLNDVANDLEAETQLANAPDGDEAPQEQPEERQEQDLTTEVELPAPDVTSTPPDEEEGETPASDAKDEEKIATPLATASAQEAAKPPTPQASAPVQAEAKPPAPPAKSPVSKAGTGKGAGRR